MPIYRFGSRYSRWDGTQQIGPLSADDLMRAMSEDLMQDGDVTRAMQRLFRWGFQRPDGEDVPGLQSLMQRLRDRRQEQQERYDLQSMLSDIADRIEQIVETERQGIAKRLDDARQGQATEDGKTAERQEAKTAGDKAGETRSSAQQSDQPGESSADGQSGQSGRNEDSETGESDAADPDLQKLLEAMAERRLQQLDALPKDPASAIRELTDYDFMDPEARQQFQELLDMLKQQMMQSTFQGMQQAIQNTSPEAMQGMKQMLSDLNQMLRQAAEGGNPDFDGFMQQWGELFPGAENLEQLVDQLQKQMAQMQSLMDSMSPSQRRQLQDMMNAALQDPELREELGELAYNLEQLAPMGDMRQRYSFRGDEPMSLTEAMKLMDDLQQLDRVERQLRDAEDTSDLEGVDTEELRRLLGDDAAQAMEQLKQLRKLLEDAGYIEK